MNNNDERDYAEEAANRAELRAGHDGHEDSDAVPAVRVVFDDGRCVAECPHCKARGLDIVTEIDKAVRFNTGELVIEGGEIVAADWGTGDTDFQHAGYFCNRCDADVALPDDIEESFA